MLNISYYVSENMVRYCFTHMDYAELWRHFVANKTGRPFSFLPVDQMQEQTIDILKSDGAGMLGRTENPAHLRKHMIALPELS